jgi:hypothetical protein
VSEVAGAEHFVLILGNSRFEAGIDPARLTAELGPRVQAQAFNGGGWDALHYYMLAILSRDLLRPGRDAVLIEVSSTSLDDGQPANRLGTLRPEAAREILALPGEPIETRLDVLTGAIAGLYRYRASIHYVALGPRIDQAAHDLEPALARLRLVAGAPMEPPYRLKLAPGRDFVIESVEGDGAALREASRKLARLNVGKLQVGGFKLTALARAVALLRDRGIAVFLVETPTADWLARLSAGSAFQKNYLEGVQRIAAESGALLLRDWQPALHDESRFWDDQHMTAGSTVDFTDALAARLRPALGW